MASSSQDAHSQPKRPAAPMRQSSTSSYVSQSPSDGPPRPAPHKVQRQHVVGQSRMQRNTSLGKNLNKLNKLSQAHAHGGDGNTGARHHRRTHSGNSSSAPSSPRSGFKRNASSGAIVRTTTNANNAASIRKNHSSGHLSRQGSSKSVLKPSKSEIAPPKQSLAQPGKAREHPQVAQPTVHFDIGNDEGGDDAWTEESASQSPTTTRSNTRSNSVILDAPKTMNTSEPGPSREDTSQPRADHPTFNHTSIVQSRAPPDSSHSSRQVNGGSSHQHSRLPDADMITSRLLQRNAPPNPPPQMSDVAATVMSDAHHSRILSQSQGSTLVDTPGRELVSRFMDGGSSAGTPRDSFLPSRNSPENGGSSGFDRAKRNKSAPNVAERGMPSPSRSQHRRSGTTTPTDLPPSRTQQKLMLQRASSNIEPQKLIPAILPRTGGPAFVPASIPYSASGEGRIDPRLQQQFNHIANEYKVVRRYRDPLADAIARLDIAPSTPRKARVPMSPMTNGSMNGHSITDLSASLHEAVVEAEGSGSGRRSRGSLESSRGGAVDEGELEARHSFESDGGRVVRNEAEEICRRLWESTETAEGD